MSKVGQESRVNIRWGKEQLDLIKYTAKQMGVPYQTYIKQTVFRQALGDLNIAENNRYQDYCREEIKTALLTRAKSFYNTGQFELALTDYAQCLKIDPSEKMAYYGRAKVLRNTKRHKESIKECSKLIKMHPDFDGGYQVRAHNYEELGQYEKAIADYAEVIKHGNEYGGYMNRADLYRRLEKFERAIADYSSAISYLPTDPDAFASRAIVYETIGEGEKASADQEKVLQLKKKILELGSK